MMSLAFAVWIFFYAVISYNCAPGVKLCSTTLLYAYWLSAFGIYFGLFTICSAFATCSSERVSEIPEKKKIVSVFVSNFHQLECSSTSQNWLDSSDFAESQLRTDF